MKPMNAPTPCTAPAGTDRRRAGRRRWLWGMLLGVLAALLLGAGLLVFRSRAAEPPEEEASFCFQLGVYGDRLAVYTGGELKPRQVLDIPLAALPESDQQLLEQGIPLRDEEELRRAIEDYS